MEMRFRKPVREFLLPDIIDGEGDIVPIIADGEDGDLEDIDVPDSIPILSLRNTVLFPGVVLPIAIGRPRSVQLIKEAYRTDKIVGTVAQKDPDTDNPSFDELHTVGTSDNSEIARDARRTTTAIIQGRKRMKAYPDSPYYCPCENYPGVKPNSSKDFDAIVLPRPSHSDHQD